MQTPGEPRAGPEGPLEQAVIQGDDEDDEDDSEEDEDDAQRRDSDEEEVQKANNNVREQRTLEENQALVRSARCCRYFFLQNCALCSPFNICTNGLSNCASDLNKHVNNFLSTQYIS